MATPTTPPFDAVEANTEFTLNAGDSFVGPPNSAGGVRDDGDEVATFLFANIAPAMSGTPTP